MFFGSKKIDSKDAFLTKQKEDVSSILFIVFILLNRDNSCRYKMHLKIPCILPSISL